jgi:hypothetical protein
MITTVPPPFSTAHLIPLFGPPQVIGRMHRLQSLEMRLSADGNDYAFVAAGLSGASNSCLSLLRITGVECNVENLFGSLLSQGLHRLDVSAQVLPLGGEAFRGVGEIGRSIGTVP